MAYIKNKNKTFHFFDVQPFIITTGLRVPQCVKYKLSVFVDRCLYILAPEYLCDELRRVADISSRQRLRSSSRPH